MRRNVNIGLLEEGELRSGDWVLIHVGFAMSKIEEAQAHDQLRMLARSARMRWRWKRYAVTRLPSRIGT